MRETVQTFQQKSYLCFINCVCEGETGAFFVDGVASCVSTRNLSLMMMILASFHLLILFAILGFQCKENMDSQTH